MIPAIEELKPLRQWVIWRTELRTNKSGKTKETKVPYNPHTGGMASTTNPDTWGTYDEARAGYRRYGGSGLGFVFREGGDYSGIDLDKCIDEQGNTSEFAVAIIERLSSYTERSPSGTGLHILVKGTLPAAIKRDSDGIEAYSDGRYFTITGDHVEGTPTTIEDRQDELDALHEEYAPKRVIAATYTLSNTEQESDVERIREALTHVPKWQDYAEWVACVAAVHSVYPNHTGIALVEGWSPGYEGEVEKMFKSFSGNGKDGVTIATVYKKAVENGWKPKVPTKFNAGDYVTATINGQVKASGKVTEVRWLPPEGDEWAPYYTIEGSTALFHESQLSEGVSEVEPPTIIVAAELDRVYPPLNETQKEQVHSIIRATYWQGFHDGMNEAQRQRWIDLGIPSSVIDWFHLGYADRLVDETTGEILRPDAMTIPFKDLNGDVIDIEYRYDGGFAYEQEGVPNFFLTDLDNVGGPTLLIDDSFAAITTYLHLGEAKPDRRTDRNYSIVGLPHRPLIPEAIDQLETDDVIVILQPGTDPKAQRLGLLKNRARYLHLDDPIDKLIASGLDTVGFMWLLQQAVRA